MRKLTIPRLEVISRRWVNDGKRIVKEGEPFLIPVDIIKNQLYYKLHYDGENANQIDQHENCIRCSGTTEDTRYTYESLFQEIYNNGWDKRYPATIIMGSIGEVYYGNGNHRLNMVMNYIHHIKAIPVCINFISDSPYLTDITYRWNMYDDVIGIPEHSSMGYYRASAKFPKWRIHDN